MSQADVQPEPTTRSGQRTQQAAPLTAPPPLESTGPAARRRTGPTGVPYWWAAPGVIFTVIVHFVLVAAGAYYAFTDWNGTAAANWVGLDNFREILASEAARGALFNTLLLAVVAVVASNTFGLVLALGLHRTVKSRNVLRAVLFAPVILSPLAVSYIWQYIFDPFGPLNSLLSAVGLEDLSRPWLADPVWAKWTVLVVLVWQYTGLAMVFYIAGLQGIPEEIEEAAAMDGASTLTRLRAITIPMLAPAMTASLTLTTIWSLRVFDQVLALTGGGPAGASETLATQVYAQTFVSGRFGYGAALALVLTALVALVSLLQLVVLRAAEKRL